MQWPNVAEQGPTDASLITCSSALALLLIKIFLYAERADLRLQRCSGNTKTSSSAVGSVNLATRLAQHAFDLRLRSDPTSFIAGTLKTGGGSYISIAGSTRRTSPAVRITQRSITFCSSRIFPGHEYSFIISSERFSICLIFLPVRADSRAAK